MPVVSVVYDPTHRRQLVSSDRYGKYNCSANTAAMGADRSTLGAVKVTGAWIRANSNEPIPDTDPSTANGPGLTHRQMRDVLKNRLKINCYDIDGYTWASVTKRLPNLSKSSFTADERWVSLAVWYADINSGVRCQQSAQFGHELLLVQRDIIDGAWRIYAHDPLCPEGRWYLESDLQGAAYTFARRAGYGPGKIMALMSGPVPRIARYKSS